MSFYERVIANDPRFGSTNLVRDVALLEPIFSGKISQLMIQSSSIGIDLLITETYRSKQRQLMLFRQGATKLRDVGVHHYGLAVDFAKLQSGKAQWSGDWSFLSDICLNLGLTWGGDWGEPLKKHDFRDLDHVQGCSTQQQAALFSGEWYPGAPDQDRILSA